MTTEDTVTETNRLQALINTPPATTRVVIDEPPATTTTTAPALTDFGAWNSVFIDVLCYGEKVGHMETTPLVLV